MVQVIKTIWILKISAWYKSMTRHNRECQQNGRRRKTCNNIFKSFNFSTSDLFGEPIPQATFRAARFNQPPSAVTIIRVNMFRVWSSSSENDAVTSYRSSLQAARIQKFTAQSDYREAGNVSVYLRRQTAKIPGWEPHKRNLSPDRQVKGLLDKSLYSPRWNLRSIPEVGCQHPPVQVCKQLVPSGWICNSGIGRQTDPPASGCGPPPDD